MSNRIIRSSSPNSDLGERPRELRLPDARRPEEQEAPDGALRVPETRPATANGLGDGLYGLVLTDHPLVEPLLQLEEPVALLLRELRDRDAGGSRDHLRDVLDGDLRRPLARVLLPGQRVLLLLQGRLQLVRLGVVLRTDRLIAFTLEAADLLLHRLRVDRLGLGAQADARRGLVDEVDRLVRQEPVADVPVGELGGRDDRLVGDPHAVEGLVPILQPPQHHDRLVDGRLADQHRLEAALERRVLLHVLAVLVDRRRADHVELASRERGLQHVRGVHRAFGRAGPDHGVHLVDEDDHLVAVVADLVDHGLQAVLELSPVLRARDHPRQVERDETAPGEGLGNLVVHDPLGDALDDRGLADAGIADQHRVVLRAPGEDLDGLLDLVGPSDHRVELALAGELGQVAAVLVERLRGAPLLRLSLAIDAADHQTPELGVREAELPKGRAGLGVLVPRERQQDVLRADVGGAELHRLLVRPEDRALGVRRERGRHVQRLTLLGRVLDLRGDRLRICPRLIEQVHDDLVAERSDQEVIRVEIEAPPRRGRLRGPLEQLPRRVAEPLGDVDLFDAAPRRSAPVPPGLPPPPPAPTAESEKKREKKSSNIPSPPKPEPRPDPIRRCSARCSSHRYRVSGG